MKTLSPYCRRLDTLELDPDSVDELVDEAAHAWYDDGCPCGVPVGECQSHPRARASQRPPEGNWRVWGYVAGRGAGKTRAGAEWIQSRAESGEMKIGALIAPTLDDVRDIMIEGPSGILAVAPPWARPKYESSKYRVTWPNGARAMCLGGEDADGPRGLNIDTIWADELAAWQRAEGVWNNAMLALRAGTKPQAMITTTPRRVAILKKIVAQQTTARTTDTTYANRHLSQDFLMEIVGMFEGSRLGRQELHAEFLETTEGVWFANFDPGKHMGDDVLAEYHPAFPVRVAIDAGTSRHTAAVFFQLRPPTREDFEWPRITIFGDYHAVDKLSRTNALAIKALADELPCRGRIDRVRLDPAADARSSLGPAAYGEYAKVLGERITERWPQHLVLDGLDTIELLLDARKLTIHTRCEHLKAAFQHYAKEKRGGEWIDYPADGHPEEDLMDALRGGIRDAMPDGRLKMQSGLRTVHARGLH